MQNLYIHCGLAESGTASIQRYLSSQHQSVHADCFEYPKIGMNASQTAHHKLSEQFTDRNGFDFGTGPVGDILRYFQNPCRQARIILSSEGFAKCLSTKLARARFMDFLREARKLNDEVFVVFRIRPFAQYVDTRYVQRLKSGLLPPDLEKYTKESIAWLENYFVSLKDLSDTIGADHIMMIDVNKDAEDAVSAFLSHVGANDRIPDNRGERFNERLGLKKAAIIYQLQQITNAESSGVGREFSVLRDAIIRSDNIPRDVFQYRVISFHAANRIQYAAHKCVSPCIRPLVAKFIEPEPEFYKEVLLAHTNLSAEDKDFLDNSLPANLRASGLFQLWRESSASSEGKK